MTNFEKTGAFLNGFDILRITEGEFKDVEFAFGKVGFKVDDQTEQCTLNFEHNIISGIVNDMEKFKECAGDILILIIQEQLEKNEVIYTGGVDG